MRKRPRSSLLAERVLAGVLDIEESENVSRGRAFVKEAGRYVPILVLVLLVDARHQGGGGRQRLVDEDEDGLFGRELDALADDVDELADGQVCGHKVLLLVDGRNLALLDLLANNLVKSQYAVRC
jgi:hypothetical protein